MRKGPQPLYTILALVFLASTLWSDPNNASGTLQGRLFDADTKAPLVGANVLIDGTQMGAATDIDGIFEIRRVPVGSYTLKFTYIGYHPVVKTDIIIKPRRMTYVYAESKMKTLETKAVEVTADFFSRTDEQPVSAVNFNNEEIRRAPGSAGDVSRILMSLPSVAMVNDQSNSLIVRGGNPLENTFFVDNIEIPNINHFPDQASSGGPIGLLNVDFIRNVDFYSGGFSPVYGDRLSAVMDIQFREGNRSEFDAQLDLNFAGFGGVAEGPLGKRGSWLVSARHSYLDFVVKVLDVGSTVAPRYGDMQWKITMDFSPAHKLSCLGVWSEDHNAPDREIGIRNDMTHYGRQDDGARTTGLTWQWIWGKSGFSTTSLAHTEQRYNQDWYETSTGNYDMRNRSAEQMVHFRHLSHLKLHQDHRIDFGFESKCLSAHYDNRIASTTNLSGEKIPELIIKERLSAEKTGCFLNYTIFPSGQWTANLGVRGDYFSINKHLTWSPRLSLACQISNRMRVSASTGLFYQNLPLLLVSRNTGNRKLSDMRAAHYILGMNYLLTSNTRITLEFYKKDYIYFPIDPSQPGFFLLDEGFQYAQSEIIDAGQAQTCGIELMAQKKLARQIYGLASVSIFKARYRGADLIWRNRKYDNQWIASVEGGYKPDSRWEFSLRWIYAGGGPYTPLNLEESKIHHRLVEDDTRINQSRYPDYHSMNLRVDRRFSFSQSNLIFYLSVWNVYNQKNVANYFWNDQEQKQDVIYQWLLLPIFGLEYEF